MSRFTVTPVSNADVAGQRIAEELMLTALKLLPYEIEDFTTDDCRYVDPNGFVRDVVVSIKSIATGTYGVAISNRAYGLLYIYDRQKGTLRRDRELGTVIRENLIPLEEASKAVAVLVTQYMKTYGA